MIPARAVEILIPHQLISIPQNRGEKPELTSLITVLSNIAYYGYALSQQAYEQLMNICADDLTTWWQELEPVFKKITSDDQNIADYVVYKNFPQEVFDMSEAEYWSKQILMYWGFPNHYFTQTPVQRSSVIY